MEWNLRELESYTIVVVERELCEASGDKEKWTEWR